MKQNNRKIIGLTGGIATGKSTVSNIIKQLGYVVIDADKIARDIVAIGEDAYKEIVQHFGEDIVDENGNINRKKLGNIVFNNYKEREILNNITHPHIMRTIKRLIDENSKERLIFIDVPLLIEGLNSFNEYGICFDEIWLVYVDEETQIQRLMERDCINREDAVKKIRAQIPIEEKIKYATKIIDNRGDISYLEKRVREMVEKAI